MDAIALYLAACQRVACAVPHGLTRGGRILAAMLAQIVGVVDPLPQTAHSDVPARAHALNVAAEHVAASVAAG